MASEPWIFLSTPGWTGYSFKSVVSDRTIAVNRHAICSRYGSKVVALTLGVTVSMCVLHDGVVAEFVVAGKIVYFERGLRPTTALIFV